MIGRLLFLGIFLVFFVNNYGMAATVSRFKHISRSFHDIKLIMLHKLTNVYTLQEATHKNLVW